jgi:hypothetical protein
METEEFAYYVIHTLQIKKVEKCKIVLFWQSNQRQ